MLIMQVIMRKSSCKLLLKRLMTNSLFYTCINAKILVRMHDEKNCKYYIPRGEFIIYKAL